uniref:Uncharacterized protein n=1 Tax=Laticauda laticaudata TaxID=8630 RepID=A0A8C5SLB7_LATLA
MGNATSCCVSSSPKLRRNAHSRLESYRPDTELSRDDTGCNLQHISDRENIDGKTRVGKDVRTRRHGWENKPLERWLTQAKIGREAREGERKH